MSRKFKFNQNQLSLPFGEKASRAVSLEDRRRFFWFIVSVSLGALLAYVYAVNAAAHHIAVRQNLEREAVETNARLSSLEFQAIALKNGITIETARAYGFTEVREPLYVSRDSSESLTLNTASR